MSKLAGVPPRRKINVTSKSPVGDISVVTLIRTDTTLDHSQKAEKVCAGVGGDPARLMERRATHRVQPIPQPAKAGSAGTKRRVLVFGLCACVRACVRPAWGQKPM